MQINEHEARGYSVKNINVVLRKQRQNNYHRAACKNGTPGCLWWCATSSPGTACPSQRFCGHGWGIWFSHLSSRCSLQTRSVRSPLGCPGSGLEGEMLSLVPPLGKLQKYSPLHRLTEQLLWNVLRIIVLTTSSAPEGPVTMKVDGGQAQLP